MSVSECDGGCCVAFAVPMEKLGAQALGPTLDLGSALETFTLLGMLEPLTAKETFIQSGKQWSHL